MTAATDLINECQSSGVELYLAGDRLRYRSQPGAYTEDLRQKVAVHRDAVIAALASRPVTLDLTREEQRQEALAAVKRGDAVLVASARLCEAVYWVRDARRAERLKRAPDYQGEIIYTLAELRELAGQGPELLRAIHQFKRAFGATLETVNQGVNAGSRNTVRCGECQHFERIDHPHTGKCAQGHGRHWLWDTDTRQCEDFEAAVEGQP